MPDPRSTSKNIPARVVPSALASCSDRNITGAMVFQSTVPVTFGILFTSWELGPLNLLSVVLALLSGTLIYAALRRRKTLRSCQLMLGGHFYLTFLAGAVAAVF